VYFQGEIEKKLMKEFSKAKGDANHKATEILSQVRFKIEIFLIQ
jgi:hypothetical protein